jgi:hypothetical protein
MLDRIASSWTGQPLAEATKISVEEPDQWTVAGQLRNLRPMYKYSWPDGQQVYLNGTNGDVVQYTTFGSRVAAHVSAIPHWVYYTPVRKHQSIWINFMVYGSLIGTIGAILGMIGAVWMYSPKLKYRLAGQPTGIPYRGQKLWHWIVGMVFGLATVTWTFSGMMSLGPFPLMQRLTGQTPRNEPPQQPSQTPPPTQQAAAPAATPVAANPGGGGGRGGGQQGIAGALRGRVRMSDFASVHPRDLLAKIPDLVVKEVEYTSYVSTPLVSANLGGGKTQLLSRDGTKVDGFDKKEIIDLV